MTASFVGAAVTTADDAAGVYPLMPDGVATGDVLIAQVAARTSELLSTGTAGWTKLQQVGDGSTPGGHEVAYFWHRVGASITRPTFSKASSSDGTLFAVTVLAYRDVHEVGTVDAFLAVANSATSPTVSTTWRNSRLLTLYSWSNGAQAWVPPLGAIVRASATVTPSALVVDSAQTQTGATPRLTAGPQRASGATHSATLALRSVNVAPSPPTRLTPDSTPLPSNAVSRLEWRHEDEDLDPQLAYELQRRTAGSSVAWTTTGEVQSPSPFYDLPAGQALGSWEWRVRTSSLGPDDVRVWSDFSPVGFYTISTPPPGPTWLEPVNGQTIGTSSYVVRWSGTGTQYRMRAVADLAGAADENAVLVAATAPASVGDRRRTWTFPVNGQVLHLQVQEADAQGLWGPWSGVRLPVSYTLPAAPVVSLYTIPERAALAASLTTPAAADGRPAPVSHEVFVREVGADGDGLRIAANIGPSKTVLWRHPVSGVDYEVRVTTLGANGAVHLGTWVRTQQGAASSNRYDTARYDTATYG